MHNNFKKNTIYQIYLRSFMDSNNDGIGDLKGVIDRLPLIAKLDIDYIWLSPFYKSHQYDNGYDVDDYMSIDPMFGDFEIFDELVRKAKELNIEIMLDMVFNHSSTHHEWFQKALAGDEYYQDYYIFKESKDGPPTNWESKFGGNAWKYVENLDKYYLHLYHKNQADLNLKNENLRNELVEVLKFWHKKGVKGFRFDVINVIDKPDIYENDYEGDGRRLYTDGPNVKRYLREIFTKAGIEDCLTVGELSSTSIEKSASYTNEKDGVLDMAFNFHHLKIDYTDGDKWSLGQMNFKSFFELLDNWQSKMQTLGGWPAWFMNNHDQPRAISRFSKNIDKYHFYVATSLAMLTHFMRGTPYIYQGEEIGLKNPDFSSIDDYRDYESINYYKILLERGTSKEEAQEVLRQKSRDNGRIPLVWNSNENGGFTKGKAWISLYNDFDINYEDSIKDINSIFNYYFEITRIRKSFPSLYEGEYKKIYIDNNIYAFIRQKHQERNLVIISMSEQNVDLPSEILEILSKDNSAILLNNYDEFDEKALLPYQSILFNI